MISTDPREAVAKALESCMRTQSSADLAEMKAEGKKSKSVRAVESHAKNAGIGADANCEYWRVYSAVRKIKHNEPAKHAVIMALSYVDSRIRTAALGEAYEALQDRIQMRIADGGKRLTPTRAVRLFALSNTLIDLDVNGRLEMAGPVEICSHAFDWYGVRLNSGNWNKDYKLDWALIDNCHRQLEYDCFSDIRDAISRTNSELAEVA